ncbi:hypothetical protein AAVH_29006 [Aphelenchoides avenae]|nr:hypothetical protein AAVH_29006 [Aphelenchus avenae]
MILSTANIISLVLGYTAVTIESTALRDYGMRHGNDSGGKLGPVVAPLYIAQYGRFEGPAASVQDLYYQLPLSIGKPGKRKATAPDKKCFARNYNLTLDLYGGKNLVFAQNFTGTTDCARKQPARNLYSFG